VHPEAAEGAVAAACLTQQPPAQRREQGEARRVFISASNRTSSACSTSSPPCAAAACGDREKVIEQIEADKKQQCIQKVQQQQPALRSGRLRSRETRGWAFELHKK